jgi:hypothetical protein
MTTRVPIVLGRRASLLNPGRRGRTRRPYRPARDDAGRMPDLRNQPINSMR